jgi:hypothetical protein
MVRAMLWLYLENEHSEREALVSEMKSALMNYLVPRLIVPVLHPELFDDFKANLIQYL